MSNREPWRVSTEKGLDSIKVLKSTKTSWLIGGWAVLAFVLLALFCTWWKGYHYGDSNQTIQIPIVKSYIDSELYLGDTLLPVRSRYTSLLYPILGHLLPRVEAIEPVYFALYILSLAPDVFCGLGYLTGGFSRSKSGCSGCLLDDGPD